MAYAIEGNIGSANFRKVFLNEQDAIGHADTIADTLDVLAQHGCDGGTFETDGPTYDVVGSWTILEAKLSVRQTLIEHFGEDRWEEQDHLYTVETHIYNNEDSIHLNWTSCNDVHGYDDSYGIANYRVLSDRWEDVEGLWRGRYSNCDVIALELDKPAPDDLIEVLESLEGYPLLDDDEHGVVEQELMTEGWTSYGQWEAHRTIAAALGLDEISDHLEGIIETLVWEGYLDMWPEVIDASANNYHEEEIAEWLKLRVGTVVTLGDKWRGSLLVDLRRHKLAI